MVGILLIDTKYFIIRMKNDEASAILSNGSIILSPLGSSSGDRPALAISVMADRYTLNFQSAILAGCEEG
ncbi:MAG: hypothetical protein ACTSRU_09045 [Candidatus Hodarchaeales archaeon]